MFNYALKKKKTMLILFLVLFGSLFASTQVRTVNAVLITVTRVFYSLPYDGSIGLTGYSYSTVRIANSGLVSNSTPEIYVGQQKVFDEYGVMRGYLFFDTSIIPDTAEISSAILSVYVMFKPANHFAMTIQNGQPTYPHIPLQSNDYYYAYYSGNGGSRDTSTMPSSGYWNITFSSTGLEWLQKTSITKLCLRSDKDINGVAPTGEDFAVFYAAEQGEDYAPKLYVTYQVEGYRYILHGPYRENGSVANQVVNATVEVLHEGYYTYTFNGADGADTYTLDFENQVLSITWNCSSVYLNTTRTIVPRSDLTFEEFWLFTVASDEWADIVTFNVVDMAGISWGYLEVWQTVGGQSRLIERVDILAMFEPTFYLVVGRTYTLRVVTNFGTASLGSYTIKPSEHEYTVILTRNMFPQVAPELTPVCNAARINGTCIQALYYDSNMTATWVFYMVTHRNGMVWIVDVEYNSTGLTGVDTFIWNEADVETSYVLHVTDSLNNHWTFSLPAPPSEVNPWEFLDMLWHDPHIRLSQLVGVFIVLMVLGLFSLFTLEAGLFAAWTAAGVLTAIGWLDISYMFLVFSLIIVFFAAYSRRKRGEDET